MYQRHARASPRSSAVAGLGMVAAAMPQSTVGIGPRRSSTARSSMREVGVAAAV
jgi:hypothetical protein